MRGAKVSSFHPVICSQDLYDKCHKLDMIQKWICKQWRADTGPSHQSSRAGHACVNDDHELRAHTRFIPGGIPGEMPSAGSAKIEHTELWEINPHVSIGCAQVPLVHRRMETGLSKLRFKLR